MYNNADAIDGLLDCLLDKYENSRHAEEAGVSLRRVLVNFSNGDIPNYFIENAEVRDWYNAAAIELKEKGLIDFEWVRGRRNLVIDKMWLVLENVAAAYEAIGRVPKKDIVQNLARQYESVRDAISTPWLRQFIGDRLHTLSSPRASLKNFERDEAALKSLIKVFCEYDKLAGEVTARAFSIKCFGDSKYFENNMEQCFLSIAGQYEPMLSEAVRYNDPGRREQLSMLGIMPMSEIYEFAGPVSFTFSEYDGKLQCMDFAPTRDFGVAVTSKMAGKIKSIDMPLVRRVVFIENRTCYEEAVFQLAKYDAQTKNHQSHRTILLVNHGGFLTSRRKEFFSLLYSNSAPGTEFFHWGDIDMGGFYMHSKLANIIPVLKPVYMDCSSIEKYNSTGIKRNDKYLKRLKEMKKEQQYSGFAGVIDMLLKYRVTIEQEVFLNDSIDSLFL